MIEAVNQMLDYDANIKVMIEGNPGDIVDRSYVGTVGYALAISAAAKTLSRVDGLLKSSNAIRGGIDPVH
jgi:xylose isomerase